MLNTDQTKDIYKLVDIVKIDEQKLVVTQANALARSAQQMTLQEKRLLLLAISQIRQDDRDFVQYRIPITTIRDYLELSHKDTHTYLKETVRKLLSRVVMIEDDEGNWKGFQWVSRCQYHTKKESEIEQAYIDIQLHDDLRPMLLNLRKHFGSVPLLQIAPMPSVNSIRVFEILWFTSMRLIKTKLSFWLDDFKKRLGVKNKYTNFKDFRREVLQRAQRDCAEYSPLTFTWEEERKGRKITRLNFTLQGNEKYSEPETLPALTPNHTPNTPEPTTPPAPQTIPATEPINQSPNSAPTTTPQNNSALDEAPPSNYKLLEEHGIADEKIFKLIAHHQADVISNNIRLIRQKHEAGKVPDGKIPAWTIKAIQEDWHGQNTKKTPLEEAQDAKLRSLAEQKRIAAEKQKQRSALEERYNKEKKEAIDALFNDERFKALNLATEQKAFLQQRIEGIPALYKIYNRSGFEAPIIKHSFRGFVADIYLPEYRDFGTWCQKNNIDLEKLA